MEMDGAYWIEKLCLSKHPEGGFYLQTYRSHEQIRGDHLPKRYKGSRVFGSAIYYLLEGSEFSAFHRIQSDEVWHFYSGSSLSLFIIDKSEQLFQRKLGRDLEDGESFQVVVPAGSWFGALVNDPASYSLVGCTVSPGFEFADFELGRRDQLLETFPAHRSIIERLTL